LVSSKVHSFHPPPSGPTVIVLQFSCVLIRLRTASPFKTNTQVTTLTLTSLLSPPRQPFSIEGYLIGEELKRPSKIPEEATSSLASRLLHASHLFYATHLLQRHFISIIHSHNVHAQHSTTSNVRRRPSSLEHSITQPLHFFPSFYSSLLPIQFLDLSHFIALSHDNL
jgi:hypothetical protein